MPTRPPLDPPRPPANADLPSLLEELAASGLSAAAFARERGIPVWRLYRAKRAAGSGSRPRSRGPNSRLIPVRLVDSPGSAPPLELQLRSGLRLLIPSDFILETACGVRVHVPVAFDSEVLHRLLTVLGAC